MNRIEFTNISLEGFRGFVHAYDFDLNHPGLNLVKGVNGARKTTIFEGLIWGLYGMNLKDQNQNEVVTWKELQDSKWQGTRVIVDFKVNDTPYSIIRHIDYSGLTEGVKGGDSLMLIENYNQVGKDRNKTELQDTINRLLGLEAKTFINSILFGQRMDKLINQDNKDKRALFEQLFDVEWVDKAKEKADLDISEIQKTLNELDRNISQTTVKVDAAKEKLESDRRILNEFEENQKEKIRVQQENIKNTDNQIQLLDNERKDVEKNVDKNFSIDELDALEKEYNKIRDIKQEKIAELAKAENVVIFLDQEINGLVKQIEGYDKQNEELSKKSDTKKQQHNTSIQEARCPVCKQPIKDQAQKEVNKEFKDSLKEINDKITENSNEITGLEEKLLKKEGERDKAVKEQLRIKNLYDTWYKGYDGITKNYLAMVEIETDQKRYNEKLVEIDNKIKLNKELLNEYTERVEILKSEKSPVLDIEGQEKAIQQLNDDLNNYLDEEEKWDKKLEIAEWWSKKALGAGGIKAFVFKAMLTQLNENTKKYGERLGVRIEFSIDLTKASKPFTTICSLGDKRDKDYKSFSGGEKQRLDIVLLFAMHDLISMNTDINILIMDEILQDLDEDGENVLFDLIRMKAKNNRSVYVITHSSTLDSLYSNTIMI